MPDFRVRDKQHSPADVVTIPADTRGTFHLLSAADTPHATTNWNELLVVG